MVNVAKNKQNGTIFMVITQHRKEFKNQDSIHLSIAGAKALRSCCHNIMHIFLRQTQEELKTKKEHEILYSETFEDSERIYAFKWIAGRNAAAMTFFRIIVSNKSTDYTYVTQMPDIGISRLRDILTYLIEKYDVAVDHKQNMDKENFRQDFFNVSNNDYTESEMENTRNKN
uniref:Uncharacterized protein n=1 Tax=Acrobeloides nanus TaxID=290746 RepID=A0A914DJ80_9BILA